jgi:hypothetical protein
MDSNDVLNSDLKLAEKPNVNVGVTEQTGASAGPGVPLSSLLDDPIEAQLIREKQRTFSLSKEIARLKRLCGEVNQASEVEEEMMINKMLGRLTEMKREKEVLALTVEQEEEQLTNTMGRRLAEVNVCCWMQKHHMHPNY